MRKSCLFIAAGAAVMICGCRTAVTGPKRVIPASPDPVAVEPAPFTPGSSYETMNKPLPPQPQPQQVAAPRFAPLEGAVSSGGVDSAPSRKVRGKKVSGKIAVPGGVYIVRSGDTPDRIARRHGVRLSALMAANNLDQKAARRLQIGQKLTIPGKDAKVAVKAKSAKTAKAAPAALDSEGKYTVQSGDVLVTLS